MSISKTCNTGVKCGFSLVAVVAGLALLLLTGCGEEKVVVRYLLPPAPVELVSPAADTFITTGTPSFVWRTLQQAVRYQLQVSTTSDFIARSVDVRVTDTLYTTQTSLVNGSYFWRVRAENADSLWGDWSDATVWAFYKSDYVNYINPVGSVHTVGIAQDVFIRGDTAYVADGQADLTMVNISNKSAPVMVGNVDTIADDFAKGAYVAPTDTFPFVYIADMDGLVQVLHIRDPIFPEYVRFGDQNTEDLTGVYISDTLFIFAVRSRGASPPKVTCNRITYEPLPTYMFVFERDLPADANGLAVDSPYVYVATGVSGLTIFDVNDVYNPVEISSLDTEGSALSISVVGNFAYIAADRAGVYVIDVADRSNPSIRSHVNTSGRSKDIDVAGNRAFVADGSAGLKVIDISNPDSAYFVAAYGTPYSYGVLAHQGYVYICDRDLGLLIFEDLSSR